MLLARAEVCDVTNSKTFKQSTAKKDNGNTTMKTDPFVLTIVVVIIISIATIGIVAFIVFDNLKNIPSGENGLIVSKSVINANEDMVELSGGKTSISFK